MAAGQQAVDTRVPVDVPEMDRQFFELQNQLRCNPRSFIPHLEQMLSQMEGNVIQRPGKPGIETEEGPSAVHEAIKYLERASPVGLLRWGPELAAAAKAHVEDIGPKGLDTHNSSDGTKSHTRCARHGARGMPCGENMSFGDETALDAVLSLFIDDGVSSRGHRDNIFDDRYKVCGVY